MPSDLEKFLQQAAERLAKKINESTQPNTAKPPLAPKRPASERPTTRPNELPTAEIVEAEIIEPAYAQRELGPDPLSSIDTRPGLAQHISQSDERLSGHLHDVFDHNVMKLRKASVALQSSKQGETEKSIDLQRRDQQVSPLVQMLRQPQTLRAAFIASEIFKRKF